MNMQSNRQSESKIPVLSPSPLRRSGSMRMGTCPPIQEHLNNVSSRTKLARHRSLQSLNTPSSFVHEIDDDVDSVKSFSSTTSICSNVSQCDHANFARNGTTYSGRCKRYVVHCSPHSTEADDYLTPTQRSNRTIRKLRNLLRDAQEELIEKDKEILRLKKEVVELRVLKVEDRESNEVDGSCKSEHPLGDMSEENDQMPKQSLLTSSPHPGTSPPPAQSLSDSGHFEDLNSPKDVASNTQPINIQIKSIESVQQQHEDELRGLKEKHNDKVESLLQRITDVNDRYYALRPLYEDCKEKLHELEKLNEELKNKTENPGTKISDSNSLNEDLLHCKTSLFIELNNLKQFNDELKLNYDKLKIENAQLKIDLEALSSLKEEKNKTHENSSNRFSSNESYQTKDLPQNILNLDNSQPTVDTCETNHQCSHKLENSELKLQLLTLVEKNKGLENQLNCDKDVYVQLYKKGIEAAKFVENQEVKSGENEDSLIPNLLQKLRITQEELDNVKAMYRRLLETRKEQPKNDPEMTLQFLKSAFYYFMTDRENAQGHLSAIESILGFNENEKINIEKAFLWR